MAYSRKIPNKGLQLRTWNFQHTGVLIKYNVEIPGVNKKEVEFPVVIKKITWNFHGSLVSGMWHWFLS